MPPACRILLAVITAFYLWTAATGWRPLTLRSEPGQPGTREFSGLHNLQAEAFLHGHLHLLPAPSPQLLQLPNPYDHRQNAPYRLSEVSLYRGKYYLYWGPTPVLLLLAPFRALTGRYLPENLAMVIFCSIALLFSTATLLYLQRRFFPAVPGWMRLAAVAALGVSSTTPFLLRRASVYEVSLASAWCLTSAAIYCLARGRFAVGGLCLGLAAGARPPFLLAAVVALFLVPRRRLARFAAPLAVCLGLLGLYNYLRFDSWTEFGLRYQLSYARDMLQHRHFDPARVPPGLYAFLLHPRQWTLEFPFWRLVSPASLRLPDSEPPAVVGVLAAMPFLAILFGLPFWRRHLRRTFPEVSSLVAGLLILAAGLALFATGVAPPELRYQLYFAGPLLLAATLCWFYLDTRFPASRLFTSALLAYGVVSNAGTSLTGEDNSLERFHPPAYRALESVFAPLQRLAVRLSPPSYGPLHLKVQFDAAPPGTSVPLVVTGDRDAGDFAFARYQQPEEVIFGFDHWGRPVSFSSPVKIRAGEAYDIELHMGSLYPASPTLFSILFPPGSYQQTTTLFLLKLNGTEVLRDQSDFYFSAPSQVTIGRNHIGGSSCGPRFTGRIRETRRIPPP